MQSCSSCKKSPLVRGFFCFFFFEQFSCLILIQSFDFFLCVYSYQVFSLQSLADSCFPVGQSSPSANRLHGIFFFFDKYRLHGIIYVSRRNAMLFLSFPFYSGYLH